MDPPLRRAWKPRHVAHYLGTPRERMAPHAHVQPARRPHTVPAPPQKPRSPLPAIRNHHLLQRSSLARSPPPRCPPFSLAHFVRAALLVSPATTRPPAPRSPIASPSALAPIRASMPTPRTRTHALLGGCEHAAHYVLSFWRARVRETSIAFACFCTWPQPTPSASAPMRAREPMCYHHHVHCPITAISGLSASRVRSVVAASVRIRDGHAASSALC